MDLVVLLKTSIQQWKQIQNEKFMFTKYILKISHNIIMNTPDSKVWCVGNKICSFIVCQSFEENFARKFGLAVKSERGVGEGGMGSNFLIKYLQVDDVLVLCSFLN